MTPYEALVSFYTIVRKDLVRIFRIWPQTFLPSVVTSVLYFLIFGTVLGSRIGSFSGVDFIDFVIDVTAGGDKRFKRIVKAGIALVQSTRH